MKNIINITISIIIINIMCIGIMAIPLIQEKVEVELKNNISNFRLFALEDSLSSETEIENYYPDSEPHSKSYDIIERISNSIDNLNRDNLSEEQIEQTENDIIMIISIPLLIFSLIYELFLKDVLHRYRKGNIYYVVEIDAVDNSNNKQRKKSNFEIEFEYYNMIIDYKISEKLKNELFSNKDDRYSINTIRKVYFFPELAIHYDKTLYYNEEIESFDDIKDDNLVGEYIFK